jgi:hypothetical protein
VHLSGHRRGVHPGPYPQLPCYCPTLRSCSCTVHTLFSSPRPPSASTSRCPDDGPWHSQSTRPERGKKAGLVGIQKLPGPKRRALGRMVEGGQLEMQVGSGSGSGLGWCLWWFCVTEKVIQPCALWWEWSGVELWGDCVFRVRLSGAIRAQDAISSGPPSSLVYPLPTSPHPGWGPLLHSPLTTHSLQCLFAAFFWEPNFF